MPNIFPRNDPSDHKAYIITGPTSGMGLATAFEVAKYGTVVLVGRDFEKLRELQQALEQKRGSAVSVVCDLPDLASVRRAAAEIIALDLPIAGLLNNAGIFPMRVRRTCRVGTLRSRRTTLDHSR
jgi:short-subunit dehydrogenase